MSSSSSSSSFVSGEKRKLEIVEEKSDLPPVGAHHNGNFHVYFSHKIQKLEELHKRAPEEIVSNVFHQCYVHVNGATSPPLQDIRRLVTMHGGEFAAYKTSRVTHIVCEYLTDAQLKQEMGRVKLQSMANQRKIWFVQAKWVTESVSRGKRQPEADYLPRGLKGRFGGDLKSLMSSSRHTSDARPSLAVNSVKPKVESTSSLVSDEVDLLSSPEGYAKDRHSLTDEVPCFSLSQDDPQQDSDNAWSSLSEEQRDFLTAIPEHLRDELLQQLLVDNKKKNSSSSSHYKRPTTSTSSSAGKAEDFIEIVSEHNSPAVAQAKRRHSSSQMTILDDDVIDLATPDSGRKSTNRVRVDGTERRIDCVDIWGDEHLLSTLRNAINFVHGTAVEPTVQPSQTKKMKLWVDSVLEHATCPQPDSVSDTHDESIHDEDSLHWHLRRSWRLFTFYAEWLISQHLFSLWQWMCCLLESHGSCQWTDHNETEGAWKRIFMPNRFHRQEFLQWKQRSRELLAARNYQV